MVVRARRVVRVRRDTPHLYLPIYLPIISTHPKHFHQQSPES